jgi:leader peptidase (prepilin peptidase)/N-methyltransferase
MHLIELLASSTGSLVGACLLLGLIIGSFLNVVIHRLPIMLERQWQEALSAHAAAAAVPEPSPASHAPYNLAMPASACPQCHAPIPAVQNIPIISYLLLGGRCARCQTRISMRYPLVEALTALVSGAVAWRFGFGWPLLFALVLSWFLVALAFIDIEQQLLPDELTRPLLWMGLLLSLLGAHPGGAAVPVDTRSSILGATFGYLSLWSVYHLHHLVTGREGMGYGDFRLLAALGAWLGWKMLLPIILIAAVVGAIVGAVLLRARGQALSTHISFGPYLAASGCLVLLAGPGLLARELPFLVPYP